MSDDSQMWETLNCLPDAVEHMIHGDPDEADSVKASDAVRWAIAEIARLRHYAIADARCPCCEQTDKCLVDCTFAADWPAGAKRTAAARAALGVKSKEVG